MISRKGTVTAAVIVPKDFGDGAGRAFFRGGTVTTPELGVLFVPSRAVEVGMVRGILMQDVMESVSTAVFSGQSGSRFADDALKALDSSQMPSDRKRLLKEMLTGVQRYYRESTPSSTTGGTGGVFSMPYTVHEEEVTSGSKVAYNGYAHSFAGMGIQFLLFAALNMGVEMLVERQRGLWRRLRSAPVSRYLLLGARAASTTVISLATLLVVRLCHDRVRRAHQGSGWVSRWSRSADDGRHVRPLVAQSAARRENPWRSTLRARDGDARRGLIPSFLFPNGCSHHRRGASPLGGR